MQTSQTVKMLSALAQESRLAIFRLLVAQGPEGLPVGTIGERLDIPNATLSFHLKELFHAGLVTSRQTGRFVYYAPIIDAMNGLVGFLTENCCSVSGESCIVAKPPRSVKKATVKKVSVSPTRRRAS